MGDGLVLNSYCFNQWKPSPLLHICLTQPRYINGHPMSSKVYVYLVNSFVIVLVWLTYCGLFKIAPNLRAQFPFAMLSMKFHFLGWNLLINALDGLIDKRLKYCSGSDWYHYLNQWWLKPRLHYTRRDTTWLGRMIGFQWNQQDRSLYARCDATRWHATLSPELAPVPK